MQYVRELQRIGSLLSKLFPPTECSQEVSPLLWLLNCRCDYDRPEEVNSDKRFKKFKGAHPPLMEIEVNSVLSFLQKSEMRSTDFAVFTEHHTVGVRSSFSELTVVSFADQMAELRGCTAVKWWWGWVQSLVLN